MAIDTQGSQEKEAMYTVGLRVDKETYELWKQLPLFDRSEIFVKLVKHARRCEAAKKEFHWDFNLQSLEALWGQHVEG